MLYSGTSNLKSKKKQIIGSCRNSQLTVSLTAEPSGNIASDINN